MNITIKIPSPLRRFTDDQSEVALEADTVAEAMRRLCERHPSIRAQLFDDGEQLRNFVNIYLGQQNIAELEGMQTRLEKNSSLRIVPAIAGGMDAAALLSPEELARYSRHIMLPEMGVAGQQKLKTASVLIVGIGGLGSPLAYYLTAAGVGHLGLVDHDLVDETNLQRQILFGMSDIGLGKVDRAQARLQDLNPAVSITPYDVELTASNALAIMADYDLVIDGTDNFPTRYLVNDACVLLDKPNIYGSIFRFEGQASVFHYRGGPCYRCLYPEPPPPELAPSCAEGGVLGVLPALIASIQATEAIKILAGIGHTLSNRLLLYDALSLKVEELNVKRNPQCVVCGEQPSIRALIDYPAFCAVGTRRPSPAYAEIDPGELKRKLDTGQPLALIDVRESYEWEICSLPKCQHIPLAELEQHLGSFTQSDPIVCYCKTGARSATACRLLTQHGYRQVYNLTGGIAAWWEQVDPRLQKY